jgi:hypothetical protein
MSWWAVLLRAGENGRQQGRLEIKKGWWLKMADLVLLFPHPRCQVDLGWASTARALPIRKWQGDMMDGGEKRRSISSSSHGAGLRWAREEKENGEGKRLPEHSYSLCTWTGFTVGSRTHHGDMGEMLYNLVARSMLFLSLSSLVLIWSSLLSEHMSLTVVPTDSWENTLYKYTTPR